MTTSWIKRYEQMSRSHDLTGALRLADDAIKVGNTLGYHLKAVVLNRQNKNAEALPFAVKYLETCPGDAGAWMNCSAIYGNLGKMKDAEDCFNKAIALNPAVVEAWLDVASIPERNPLLSIN